MSYGTWDTETTITSSFKRKANPFDQRNWVVTHAVKKKGATEPTEYRFGHQRPGPGWLKPVLEGIKLLIGFNIKFDLLHALQDAENLEVWMAWVAAGGNVWDCQLAEYLLNGMDQKNQMLSLEETAIRYGGDLKFDEIKVLWGAGVNTCDIEPTLLSRYLCGRKDETGKIVERGDVENTELVALAQIQRARECGQLNSILMNMGSLLCSIEMERNGMFIDVDLGYTLARELEKSIEEVRTELHKYLPKDMPFEFNWGSTKQKSALIFGGTVQWDAYEYDVAEDNKIEPHAYIDGKVYRHEYEALPPERRPKLKYTQRDEVAAVLAADTANNKAGDLMPLEWCKASNVPVVRYASGKNAGEVKTKKIKVDDLTKPKGRAAKAPYVFKRITAPDKRWETSEPGVWSTSSAVIEELGMRDVPFTKALASLSAMVKDLGTYFIVTDEDGKQSGMLSLVDVWGLIHHGINHVNTVTGRFSSSNPNLQNIPKGNKSKVKLVFVSRFRTHTVVDDFGDLVSVGGKIIQSDFSSLEIYVQAILTRCKQLIIDLKAGLDLHVKRLSIKEGKPYDEVLLLCKGDKKRGIEADKEWDYKRTGAKVFSFQRAYGAGAAKIATSTGMPIGEVEALIEAEDKVYPEIGAYFDALTKEIKQNRKPGVAVPHPDVPGILCNLGRSFVRTPDGKLYSYQEQPSPEYLVKRGTFSSFSPTEVKNYSVQGEGGEWAKAAMWLAIREFYRRRNFGGKGLLVNQVHDAVYADAHDDVAQEVAAVLHAAMEAASDFMEHYFAWPLPLPVPSDTTWGTSMMDEKDIPGVKERARGIRNEMRSLYMNGYTPTFEKAA